jgi:hypothetical protein
MVPALPLVGGSFPWLVIAAALILWVAAGAAVAMLESRMASRAKAFTLTPEDIQAFEEAA